MGIPGEGPFNSKEGERLTDIQFEQAALAYGDMIFRIACHALGCRADGEDVTQTVLMKLYETSAVFDTEAHLKHWLIRVTVNESRRLLRKPWRARQVPLEEWDGVGEPARDSGVLDAVMALDAKYRVPVYLYYYEGLSVKEIAQVMKTGVSTVQTRLQRAREKLKLTLTEEGSDYVQPGFLP